MLQEIKTDAAIFRSRLCGCGPAPYLCTGSWANTGLLSSRHPLRTSTDRHRRPTTAVTSPRLATSGGTCVSSLYVPSKGISPTTINDKFAHKLAMEEMKTFFAGDGLHVAGVIQHRFAGARRSQPQEMPAPGWPLRWRAADHGRSYRGRRLIDTGAVQLEGPLFTWWATATHRPSSGTWAGGWII